MLAGLCFVLCAAGWMSPEARSAEDPELLEAQIKAAFLYKFAGYVEWPKTAFALPETPFTIAVMGDNPVAVELVRVVTGRRINDRNVIIKQLGMGDPVAGAHILFIGSDMSAQLARLLQTMRPQPVLTVTETEGALTQGSVINFVVSDRRIRFEISRGAADRNQLRLSSRLLAVAQHVEDGP